jgi:hypothetical protein
MEKEQLYDLTRKVFDCPEGHELLAYWMEQTGISVFKGALTDEERLRNEERRRFVFSILEKMSVSSDQMREAIINVYQHKHNERIAHGNR